MSQSVAETRARTIVIRFSELHVFVRLRIDDLAYPGICGDVPDRASTETTRRSPPSSRLCADFSLHEQGTVELLIKPDALQANACSLQRPGRVELPGFIHVLRGSVLPASKGFLDQCLSSLLSIVWSRRPYGEKRTCVPRPVAGPTLAVRYLEA